MLSVPLPIQLRIAQPEVRREIHDKPGSRIKQLPDRLCALAVPESHEGHVEFARFDLLGRYVLFIDGQLRIDLADAKPRIPARRDPQRPDPGMPGEQPHKLYARVPSPTVNTNVQSHAANCRTYGYLFKFLHISVDL